MSALSITITLPNQSQQTYPSGITSLEIAKKISHSLAKKVLAAEVNGMIWDLTRPITQDVTLRLLTWEDQGGKHAFWHSSAHLLAEALQSLYPQIKLGIGPAIEKGFYYDIDFGPHDFDASHFPRVIAKMKTLAAQKNAYIRIPISKEEAIQHFQTKQSTYKLELLQDLTDGHITLYQQGSFKDLCRGPHLPHTGYIKAIHLSNIAGAYWRGNAKNTQLTRIYGITFPTQQALDEHLAYIEAARKRDHRKLGKALGLFTFSDQVGLGLPLWLPKGTFVRQTLTQFLRKAQAEAGYLPVITPHIGHKKLYVTSGHFEKYGQDAFQPIQTPQKDEVFLLKPMNCPHHCEIYKSSPRSYKQLPLRFAEFGTVYRYEQHGELHGLVRVRGFTQDDAHIFCTPEQTTQEIARVIDLVLYVFNKFDFQDYQAQISLRDPAKPEKYIGDPATWDAAEKALQQIAKAKGLKTTIAYGEAAFYGPKIDFMVRDALGRCWQLGTVQLDYQLPQRFQLTYTGADNQKHTPVMIHRAPFGSLERFIAILLEHTAGQLPLWLVPTQIQLLPISNKYVAYAEDVKKQLVAHQLRVTIDARDEKLSRKIRDAELAKIPYILVIGEKEQTSQTVAIRRQGKGQQTTSSVSAFIQHLQALSTL